MPIRVTVTVCVHPMVKCAFRMMIVVLITVKVSSFIISDTHSFFNVKLYCIYPDIWI